jgi:manganese/zinc/iron transport system ATP- binding protein
VAIGRLIVEGGERQFALEVEDLTVAYSEQPVLWDVDLQVPAGVKMAIVGPNGAGKSTLVKAAMGLVKPVAGEVRVFGRPFERARGEIAYVPQRATLSWDFPTDVIDVVTMGTYGSLGWGRRVGSSQRREAEAALAKVGMSDFTRRPIAELSGGQQQRVLLGRALAQDAPIYILDEPFQGVDAPTERAIIGVDELTGQAINLSTVNYRWLEYFTVVAGMYVVLTFIASIGLALLGRWAFRVKARIF